MEWKGKEVIYLRYSFALKSLYFHKFLLFIFGNIKILRILTSIYFSKVMIVKTLILVSAPL